MFGAAVHPTAFHESGWLRVQQTNGDRFRTPAELEHVDSRITDWSSRDSRPAAGVKSLHSLPLASLWKLKVRALEEQL